MQIQVAMLSRYRRAHPGVAGLSRAYTVEHPILCSCNRHVIGAWERSVHAARSMLKDSVGGRAEDGRRCACFPASSFFALGGRADCGLIPSPAMRSEPSVAALLQLCLSRRKVWRRRSPPWSLIRPSRTNSAATTSFLAPSRAPALPHYRYSIVCPVSLHFTTCYGCSV